MADAVEMEKRVVEDDALESEEPQKKGPGALANLKKKYMKALSGKRTVKIKAPKGAHHPEDR